MSDDDHGAFRAEEPGTGAPMVLRPGRAGLAVERGGRSDVVAWEAVQGVTLLRVASGRASVAAMRIRCDAGHTLDLADAFAAGAHDLPDSLEPGAPPLLRVERCRLLAAVVIASASLAPATLHEFARGPRSVPIPPLASRPRAFPRWMAPALFALSAAALVVLVGASVAAALAILLVFLAHEAGHAFALRAVGAGVRGFLFFPLLGAGTVPDHPFASRWDEARVALAGPATGVPAAGVFALLAATGQASRLGWGGAVVAGMVAAIAVNGVNLLPLLPLDGGAVLSCLAAGQPPAARAVIVCAPIGGLALAAAAFAPRPHGLVVAAVFVGLAVALTRTRLRRERLGEWMAALPCAVGAVRAALRDVTFALSGRAREDADGGAPPSPLTRGQAGAVLALYAAEVAALAGAAALFVRAFPQSLEALRGVE